MTRTRKHLLVVAALVAALAAALACVWTPLAIDRCLDRGGKWSAENRACAFEDP